MTRDRDWDEREHPRWPDGAPGGKGGEFRDKGAPGGDWASRIDALVAQRATALKPARPAKRVSPPQVVEVGGSKVLVGVKEEPPTRRERAERRLADLQAALGRATDARKRAKVKQQSAREVQLRSRIREARQDIARIDREETQTEKVEIPLRGGETLVVEREVKDEVPAHIKEATARFQRGEISAGQLAAILEGREPTPMPKLTPKAAKFLVEYRLNSRLNAGERIPIQLTREGLVKVRTGKNGLGMKERWLEVTPAGRDVQQYLQNNPPQVRETVPKKAAEPKLRKSLRPGDVVEWTDEHATGDERILRGTVRKEGRFTMVDWESGRSEKVSARGIDPSIRKVSDAPADYVQPEETKPPTKKAPATARPKTAPVSEWSDEEIAEQLLKKRPGTAVYAKILAEFNRRNAETEPASPVDLNDVMKQTGIKLDHGYMNRSAYQVIQRAREKLRQGASAKEVAAWLRTQATGLTSEEDDQTSMLQMDRETLRERLRAGKRTLRELATALTAYRGPRPDWASEVDARIAGPKA